MAGVAPGLPPQTLAGLAAAVTQAADNGTAAVELIMDPEELGPLRFELTRMGEQIHIHLTVDRADTLDLLRRHADQLLADLRASGFVGASLSFDSRSQGRGAAASSVVAPSATVSPPPPPVGPAPDSGLGLDLRL